MQDIISDIIDQRLDEKELVTRLKTLGCDEQSIKSWRNCHLIGDVLRGDVAAAHGCLIERIDKALVAESQVVVTVPEFDEKKDVTRPEVWKSAGLFAVAASLALVAVVSFSPTDSPNEPVTSAIATAVPATAVGETSLAQIEQPTAAIEMQAPGVANFEAEFGQMLVEHGEFSASSGLNGLIAYSKLVSNETLDQ
jgi:sigma-E factor negative regulatory protein RseA